MVQVLGVGQLVQYVQDLLDADPLLGDLWVAGEVSNVSRSSAGHVYFTLKDAHCQLRCAFFRHAVRGFIPANGDAVVAHGRVSMYLAIGGIQLYADFAQPEGVGPLHLQFEYLRQRLEDEGLFDPGRKRPLPEFPRRIGLVTSPTGAVLQDIWQVIGRRYPYVELILAPTLVQGDRAAAQIVRAIEALNAEPDLDLIVIARGGGSLEDLWPFNEEVVARAIFSSRVPVVSAVGHETDVTIADLVADYRAPTPSAAAEAIVPDAHALWRRVNGCEHALGLAIGHYLSDRRLGLEQLTHRLQAALPDLTNQQRVLALLSQHLSRTLTNRLALAEQRVATRSAQLAALSPRRTLARGYAIVTVKGCSAPLRDPAGARTGDPVSIQLSQGTLTAEVTGR